MDDAPYIKILPHLNSPRGQDLKQRFWEKIAKSGDDECWHWTGHCKDGYGRMKIAAYTSVYASRIALAIATGVEPEGMHALHSCDNPPCCNPRHLRWGTQEDNMRDKVLRGRGRTGDQAGENNGAAKISTRELAKVIDGFRRGLNNKQIARELPIGHAMVSKIRRGHMWREQARSLGWTGAPDSRFPTRLSEGSLS